MRVRVRTELCTDWMAFQTVCWVDGTTMDPLIVSADPDKGADAGTQII